MPSYIFLSLRSWPLICLAIGKYLPYICFPKACLWIIFFHWAALKLLKFKVNTNGNIPNLFYRVNLICDKYFLLNLLQGQWKIQTWEIGKTNYCTCFLLQVYDNSTYGLLCGQGSLLQVPPLFLALVDTRQMRRPPQAASCSSLALASWHICGAPLDLYLQSWTEERPKNAFMTVMTSPIGQRSTR